MNKSNFDTIYVFCCYCSEGDFQQVFCLLKLTLKMIKVFENCPEFVAKLNFYVPFCYHI